METQTFKAENQVLMMTSADLQNAITSILGAFMDEQKAKEQERLVSLEEAMKIFHVTQQTLIRWGKVGYLVPIRIGRKIFYKQADIDNVMNIENVKQTQTER